MNENQRKICTEIWQEYESQLRKICKIKLQSHPNEIDDVMSEVSLALCKQIKKYGEPNKPKQWLYATLNNIINLKYRELYKFKEKQFFFVYQLYGMQECFYILFHSALKYQHCCFVNMQNTNNFQ